MKLKKLVIACAASAVAMSTLAFVGCDKTPEGAIKGNYVEKTDEEMQEIIDGIDFDKVLKGDADDPEATAINLGIGADFNFETAMGGSTASIGFKLDYKEASSGGSPAGAGTVSVKISSKEDKKETSAKLTGAMYVDTEWAYANMSGEFKGDDVDDNAEIDKLKEGVYAKLDLAKLLEAFGDSSFTPVAFYESDSGISIPDISGLLQTAKQYGVSVTADTEDGVKLKISANANTIWTAYAQYLREEGALEEVITVLIEQYKEALTFNAFAFDVYFAVDKDNRFAGASVVTDIDVKIDLAALGSSTYASESSDSVISFKIKGSLRMFAHEDTVTIPEKVKTDERYEDQTEFIIQYVENLIK